VNRILNMHNYRNWAEVLAQYPDAVYVGRENKGKGLVGGPLQNPFRLGKEEERGSTLTRYRAHLWAKIQEKDEEVLAALKRIGPDTTLVCWCAPLPCHAEVVAKAAEWLRDK
jgi:hypothetical protein